MNSLDKLTANRNWRAFILFLLIFFILGLLLIFFIFPSIFSGPEIRKIPIIFDEEPKSKVEREDILLPISNK